MPLLPVLPFHRRLASQLRRPQGSQEQPRKGAGEAMCPAHQQSKPWVPAWRWHIWKEELQEIRCFWGSMVWRCLKMFEVWKAKLKWRRKKAFWSLRWTCDSFWNVGRAGWNWITYFPMSPHGRAYILEPRQPSICIMSVSVGVCVCVCLFKCLQVMTLRVLTPKNKCLSGC